jgi:hypothetical protein
MTHVPDRPTELDQKIAAAEASYNALADTWERAVAAAHAASLRGDAGSGTISGLTGDANLARDRANNALVT